MNFQKDKFEKAIKRFRFVESDNVKFDSAQFYIQLAKKNITFRDSLIEIRVADSLVVIKVEEELQLKNRQKKILSLIKDFIKQIEAKTQKIDNVSTQASNFLSNYGKGKVSARRTVEALDIAINTCNNENMYSIKVPSEFNQALNEQCEQLLDAYSTAYSSKILAYDYGKRAIQNNDASLLVDANRNAFRSLQELTDAVVLNLKLRSDFDIKIAE